MKEKDNIIRFNDKKFDKLYKSTDYAEWSKKKTKLVDKMLEIKQNIESQTKSKNNK